MKKILVIGLIFLCQTSFSAVISENVNILLPSSKSLNIRKIMNDLRPKDFVKAIEVTAFSNKLNAELVLYVDSSALGAVRLTQQSSTYRFNVNLRNGTDYSKLLLVANGAEAYISDIKFVVESMENSIGVSAKFIEKTFLASTQMSGTCGNFDYKPKVQMDAVMQCQNAGAINCIGIGAYENETYVPHSGAPSALTVGNMGRSTCSINAYATGKVRIKTQTPNGYVQSQQNAVPSNEIPASTGITNNSGQVIVVNGNSNQIVISSATQSKENVPTRWECRFNTAYNPAPGFGSSEVEARSQAKRNCIDIQYQNGGLLQYTCPIERAVCNSN